LTDWDKEHISEAVKQVGEDLKLPAKVIMQVLRFAVAGLEPGVGVPVIIQILGKEKVLSRLKACQPSDKAI
jgi:glutamyl/glutaminyl-tRNA synthetase